MDSNILKETDKNRENQTFNEFSIKAILRLLKKSKTLRSLLSEG